jgi:hypothetical protein
MILKNKFVWNWRISATSLTRNFWNGTTSRRFHLKPTNQSNFMRYRSCRLSKWSEVRLDVSHSGNSWTVKCRYGSKIRSLKCTLKKDSTMSRQSCSSQPVTSIEQGFTSTKNQMTSFLSGKISQNSVKLPSTSWSKKYKKFTKWKNSWLPRSKLLSKDRLHLLQRHCNKSVTGCKGSPATRMIGWMYGTTSCTAASCT